MKSLPDTWFLKSVGFDKVDNKFYLNLTYHIENENVEKELRLYRVELPFTATDIPIIYSSVSPNIWTGEPDTGITLNGVDMHVRGGIHEQIIKHKVKEMTLEEIEKKLGHKVKIVSEGKKK